MAVQCVASFAGHTPAHLAAAGMSADRTRPEPREHPIYVVDDDESVRDSLSVLLETLGFEVLTHGSASDMLADERRRDAGCVIVDQHMPGMDGLAMLATLQHEGVAAPAILITGRLDSGIAARASALGVAAVLEKPFPTRRLVELVRNSLGRLQ